MWEMTGRKLPVMMMLMIRSDITIMTLGSWLVPKEILIDFSTLK